MGENSSWIASYNNVPAPGSILVNGPRNLSVNVKVSLPSPWVQGSQWAFGGAFRAGKVSVPFLLFKLRQQGNQFWYGGLARWLALIAVGFCEA